MIMTWTTQREQYNKYCGNIDDVTLALWTFAEHFLMDPKHFTKMS